MPTLNKLLSRFSKKERQLLESLIEAIISLQWQGLDIKKLRDRQNIFLVRKGNLRIIFSREGKDIFILTVSRRREDTYKF